VGQPLAGGRDVPGRRRPPRQAALRRRRHRPASLGFLFIVGADIPNTGLEFAVDMLRKLVREPDVYECACLLVIDGTQGVEEDDGRTGPPRMSHLRS